MFSPTNESTPSSSRSQSPLNLLDVSGKLKSIDNERLNFGGGSPNSSQSWSNALHAHSSSFNKITSNMRPTMDFTRVGPRLLPEEQNQQIRIQLAVNRYNGTISPRSSFFRVKSKKQEPIPDSPKSPEIRYNGVGNFPTVILDKSRVALPRKQNIVSHLRTLGQSSPSFRVLDALKPDEETSTRSVLDVLQDLSRKRLRPANVEDQQEISTKRKCRGLGGGENFSEGEINYRPLFVTKPRDNLQTSPRKDQETQTFSLLTNENITNNEPKKIDSKLELRRKLARKNNEILASLSSSIGSVFLKRKRDVDRTTTNGHHLPITDVSTPKKAKITSPEPQILVSDDLISEKGKPPPEKQLVVYPKPKTSPLLSREGDRFSTIFKEMQFDPNAKLNALKSTSPDPKTLLGKKNQILHTTVVEDDSPKVQSVEQTNKSPNISSGMSAATSVTAANLVPVVSSKVDSFKVPDPKVDVTFQTNTNSSPKPLDVPKTQVSPMFSYGTLSDQNVSQLSDNSKLCKTPTTIESEKSQQISCTSISSSSKEAETVTTAIKSPETASDGKKSVQNNETSTMPRSTNFSFGLSKNVDVPNSQPPKPFCFGSKTDATRAEPQFTLGITKNTDSANKAVPSANLAFSFGQTGSKFTFGSAQQQATDSLDSATKQSEAVSFVESKKPEEKGFKFSAKICDAPTLPTPTPSFNFGSNNKNISFSLETSTKSEAKTQPTITLSGLNKPDGVQKTQEKSFSFGGDKQFSFGQQNSTTSNVLNSQKVITPTTKLPDTTNIFTFGTPKPPVFAFGLNSTNTTTAPTASTNTSSRESFGSKITSTTAFGSFGPTVTTSVSSGTLGPTVVTTTKESLPFGPISSSATTNTTAIPSGTNTFSFGSSQKLSAPSTTSVTFGSFGSTTTTNPLAFGSLESTSTTTSASIIPFGSAPITTPSTFGPLTTAPTTTSAFGTFVAVSTASSPFGSFPVTTTPKPPTFGLFGTVPSTAPVTLESTSTTTSFASPITSTTFIPSQQSTPATSTTTLTTPGSTSFFGSGVTTSSGTFGSFGLPITSTAPFGAFGATTTATPSIFGSSSTTIIAPTISTTSAPTFGTFGQPTSTTASSFGSFGTTTTTGASFGPFGSTVLAPSSTFGSSVPATTTTGTPFGSFGSIATNTVAPAPFGNFGTTTTTALPFGSFVATTSSSPFGTFGTNTATTSAPFGTFASTSTTTSAPFAFGPSSTPQTFGSFGPTTTTTAGFGSFGSATSTTTSLFGAITTTTAATTTTSSFGSAFAPQQSFGSAPQNALTGVFPNPTAQSTPFAFNANQTAPNVQNGQPFKFGSPSPASGQLPGVQPFKFGSNNPTAGPQPFNFQSPATPSSGGFNFGSGSSAASNSGVFSFGATTPNPGGFNMPGFSIGTTSSQSRKSGTRKKGRP